MDICPLAEQIEGPGKQPWFAVHYIQIRNAVSRSYNPENIGSYVGF